MGPPPASPNWFWRSGVRAASKKPRASTCSLRRDSHSVPWYWFVPGLLTTLMIPPVTPPYSGNAPRASLTYKKLARHGSPTWQQKFRFGQLLEGSNKKLAVGTYEAALSDLVKLGKKKEAAEILDRVVALEPTQANLLRMAELASELGNRKVAASAYERVAELAAVW